MDKFQNLIEALQRYDGPDRFDAAESAFLPDELEQVRAEVYEVEYPEFKWRRFLPEISVDRGANVYTYKVYDKAGEAKLISNYADDLPSVSVSGREVAQLMKSYGDSYWWSIQEMRAAAMSGSRLDRMKAKSARFMLENKLESVFLSGDATAGLNGLFNLTGTLTHTLLTGS